MIDLGVGKIKNYTRPTYVTMYDNVGSDYETGIF